MIEGTIVLQCILFLGILTMKSKIKNTDTGIRNFVWSSSKRLVFEKQNSIYWGDVIFL